MLGQVVATQEYLAAAAGLPGKKGGADQFFRRRPFLHFERVMGGLSDVYGKRDICAEYHMGA